jgi:hypothetical protein
MHLFKVLALGFLVLGITGCCSSKLDADNPPAVRYWMPQPSKPPQPD